MKTFASLLRGFSKIWLYFIAILVALGGLLIWANSGWSAFTEALNPFNFWNVITFCVLCAPSLIGERIADAIDPPQEPLTFLKSRELIEEYARLFKGITSQEASSLPDSPRRMKEAFQIQAQYAARIGASEYLEALGMAYLSLSEFPFPNQRADGSSTDRETLGEEWDALLENNQANAPRRLPTA